MSHLDETGVGSDLLPRCRVIFIVIAILALVGMAVSAISLQRHYAKSTTQFCDFREKFSCDIVNRSEYSTIVGIPVAAIGVLGYGLIFVLSCFLRRQQETPIRLLIASSVGLAFALYLTYIEAFVLDHWCILCLISLFLILSITVSSTVARLRT